MDFLFQCRGTRGVLSILIKLLKAFYLFFLTGNNSICHYNHPNTIKKNQNKTKKEKKSFDNNIITFQVISLPHKLF